MSSISSSWMRRRPVLRRQLVCGLWYPQDAEPLGIAITKSHFLLFARETPKSHHVPKKVANCLTRNTFILMV